MIGVVIAGISSLLPEIEAWKPPEFTIWLTETSILDLAALISTGIPSLWS